MLVIIAVITIFLTCVAFVLKTPFELNTNPLVAFAIFIISTIKIHYVISLALFLLLTFLFYKTNFDKKHSRKKIFFFSALQSVALIIVSFFSSFLLLCIIALFQLNILASIVTTNPTFLGIKTNTNDIVETLKKNNRAPEVITTYKKESLLFYLASATTGKNNFYGTTILSSIPSALIIPIDQANSPMYLLDNTLVMYHLTSSDSQKIGPLLSYLFIKDYFPMRAVKAFPHIVIMDKNTYLSQRENVTEETIKKIDTRIQQLDSITSSLSANLPQDRKARKNQEKLVEEYLYYKNVFTQQKNRLQNARQLLHYELASFVSNDAIHMIADDTNSHTPADYLATITHEYLHYASYVSRERRLTDIFFEEGLTEYFTRKIIFDALQTPTNLGYPLHVKIIDAMTTMITESEFAEIYFTKDQAGLERALDRVYGDGFYENSQLVFYTLHYTTESKEALMLANHIMKRIGAQQLSEKDLKTHSGNNL